MLSRLLRITVLRQCFLVCVGCSVDTDCTPRVCRDTADVPCVNDSVKSCTCQDQDVPPQSDSQSNQTTTQVTTTQIPVTKKQRPAKNLNSVRKPDLSIDTSQVPNTVVEPELDSDTQDPIDVEMDNNVGTPNIKGKNSTDWIPLIVGGGVVLIIVVAVSLHVYGSHYEKKKEKAKRALRASRMRPLE